MVMRREGDRDNDSGLDSFGRLNTSIFYGENTNEWVSEAEKIFSKNRLSEVEKIEAVVACFDWQTWNWYEQLRPVRTWDELKVLMMARFHGKQISVVGEISYWKQGNELNWKTENRETEKELSSPEEEKKSEVESEKERKEEKMDGINAGLQRLEAVEKSQELVSERLMGSNRLELLMQKLGELQHLPRLEKSGEYLTQHMAKVLQSMEDTQKAVAALYVTEMGPSRNSEGDGSGSITEGPTPYGSLCKKILTINQGGTVAEFQREFELLASLLRRISDEEMEITFVNGLKPEISLAEVRLLSPTNLDQLMEVAQKNFTEQMKRRGHAVKEDNAPPSRSVIGKRYVEGGGKDLVNGLIQGKMVEEMLLNLVGLNYGREVAQQQNYKFSINKAPGGMGLNKENEDGPKTIVYNQKNALVSSPCYANMQQSVAPSIPKPNSTYLKQFFRAKFQSMFDLTAEKKIEIRIEAMEKKLKKLKTRLQCLPGLERAVNHLTQSMAKMTQSLEAIQKDVASLINSKAAMNRNFEGLGLQHKGTTKEEEMLEALAFPSLEVFEPGTPSQKKSENMKALPNRQEEMLEPELPSLNG